jgi:hypothetical protein
LLLGQLLLGARSNWEKLVLTWPASAGGYGGETTPSLALPGWKMITNVPDLSANRYTITNSVSDETRFYRLRQR